MSFKDRKEEDLERVLSVLINEVQIEPDSKKPTYIKAVLGIGYKFAPRKAEK